MLNTLFVVYIALFLQAIMPHSLQVIYPSMEMEIHFGRKIFIKKLPSYCSIQNHMVLLQICGQNMQKVNQSVISLVFYIQRINFCG